MQVTALMPIKKQSERLVDKNRKIFAGHPLFHIMYENLLKVQSISQIIVNTDCDEVKDYLHSKEKIRIIERPEHLLGNHIVANDLINYDVNFSGNEHFLQTHCTNPLLSSSTIESAIKKYFSDLDKCDSLF